MALSIDDINTLSDSWMKNIDTYLFDDKKLQDLFYGTVRYEQGREINIPLAYEVNPIDKDLETTKVEFD